MAIDASLSDLIHQGAALLEAQALAIGRPAGAAVVLPIFTRAQLGNTIKGSFAFALSLVAAPPIAVALQANALSSTDLVLLELKEVVIGALVGFLLGLPIWTAEAAGELLDTQRSATQDRQSVPGTGDQDSTTASFLGVTLIALFVMMGGLVVLARTIDDSYAVWPPLSFRPLPTHGWATFLLGMLDRLSRASLALAAPLILGMLLCEACVILLMRGVPKLHMYDLAPTLRNLIFALMMFAYVEYLVAYMRQDVDQVAGATAAIRSLFQ